jgi:hypothetical protein
MLLGKRIAKGEIMMRFIALSAAALVCSIPATQVSAQTIQVVRNGGPAQTIRPIGGIVRICRTSPVTRISFGNTRLTISGPGQVCTPGEPWHLIVDMAACDFVPVGSNFRGRVVKTCR